MSRDGTILNITESMRYYTIWYCYRLYIALDDNIEKAVISLKILQHTYAATSKLETTKTKLFNLLLLIKFSSVSVCNVCLNMLCTRDIIALTPKWRMEQMKTVKLKSMMVV